MIRAESIDNSDNENDGEAVTKVDLAPLSIFSTSTSLSKVIEMNKHASANKIPSTEADFSAKSLLDNHDISSPNTRKSIMEVRRLQDLQDENESLKLQLHKIVAQLANTEFSFADKLDRMNLAHLMEIESLQNEHQADVAELNITISSLKYTLARAAKQEALYSPTQNSIASPNDTSFSNYVAQTPTTPGTPVIARDWGTQKLQMASDREKERLSQELFSSMKKVIDLQNKISHVEDELVLISTKYQDAVSHIDDLQKENEELKHKVDGMQQHLNVSLSDDENADDFTKSSIRSPITSTHSKSSLNTLGRGRIVEKKDHLDLLDFNELGL